MLTMKLKPVNGTESGSQYHELKERLHQRVIEMLDLNAIGTMSEGAVTEQLSKLIEQLLQQEAIPLNQRERAQMTLDILHEVLGLGPLEPLLADQSVNDILGKLWTDAGGLESPFDFAILIKTGLLERKEFLQGNQVTFHADDFLQADQLSGSIGQAGDLNNDIQRGRHVMSHRLRRQIEARH